MRWTRWMKPLGDPTRTLLLRAQAVAEIKRRFKRVIKAVSKYIKTELITNAPLASILSPFPKKKFVYEWDATKLKEFEIWLSGLIVAEILNPTSVDVNKHWINTYIAFAYFRGQQKTLRKLSKKVAEPILGLQSIYTNPAHVKRSEVIYTRAYKQLAGVTDYIEANMSRVLSDGILKGVNPTEVAEELKKVGAIGINRATLIARTEIVNAHNVAAIVEAESLEGVIGEEIKMEWITSIDGRERSSHRARNGKVYSKDKVRTLIGEPNCRCAVAPAIE